MVQDFVMCGFDLVVSLIVRSPPLRVEFAVPTNVQELCRDAQYVTFVDGVDEANSLCDC